MRIVIDMQGMQSPTSQNRGVGRYTEEMVKALIRNKKSTDEIFLALNGAFKEACDRIIHTFSGLLPKENIKVWHWYPRVPIGYEQCGQSARPEELFREWFLNQFEADIIWNPNLQEGQFDENMATSVKTVPVSALVCSTLHDVIPLIYAQSYLKDPRTKCWYDQKIAAVQKSDYVLTVSEFSRMQIMKRLGIPADRISAILESADFKKFFSDEKTQTFAAKKNFILYTGGIDAHKNLRCLFKAFALLPKRIKDQYVITLSGKEPAADQKMLRELARKCGLKERYLSFTGYISDAKLRELMQTCAAFVFPSYSEGFGLPAVEAMACGAPTLVANAASLPEIVADPEMMFDPFSAADLSQKLERVLTDAAFTDRKIKSQLNRAHFFSWDKAGQELYQTFERLVAHREIKSQGVFTKTDLIETLHTVCKNESFDYLLDVAKSIEDSLLFAPKRIFVDCSAVVLTEYVTGIQRVVNGMIQGLKELCDQTAYQVIPIYSDAQTNYYLPACYDGKRYVKKPQDTADRAVQFRDGDVLLMPDLHPSNVYSKKAFFRTLSLRGVKIHTILHDIIPTDYPQFFSKDFVDEFKQYLMTISELDGVISVSKATQQLYTTWCRENGIVFRPDFVNTYNYNGCNFNKANPSKGLPADYTRLIDKMRSAPTFLMVSTIEPRKQHAQVLSAMEILWKKERAANLVFVGRAGWQMEPFIRRMKKHPQLHHRFEWLTGISDEFLEKIYQASAAVVVASVQEGFGLPIIEGNFYEKPIIARDIPVFREIAGDNARYFSGLSAENLAEVLEEWLKNPPVGTTRKIETVSWKMCARNLLDKVGFKADLPEC